MNVGEFNLADARNSELIALRLVIRNLAADLRAHRHPRVAAALESFVPAIESEAGRRVAGAGERAVYLVPALSSLTVADLGRLARAAEKCATGAARINRTGAAAFWFTVAGTCQHELQARGAATYPKGLLN